MAGNGGGVIPTDGGLKNRMNTEFGKFGKLGKISKFYMIF